MIIKDFLYVINMVGDKKIDILDDEVIYLLSYFSGKPIAEIESLSIPQYQKLFIKYSNKFNFNPETKIKKWFYYDKNIWIKIPNEQLNWGDFLDLYKFTQNPFKDIKNLTFILLKLYKPYFSIKKLPDFSELDINHVYASIEEIINFVANKLKRYKKLFKQPKKEDPKRGNKKEKKDNWGLLSTTFAILNDDITKLEQINKSNIDTILIYLVWKMEQNEEMEREFEKNRLRR